MAETTTNPTPPQERELWALAGIALVFHWCEELLNILNGPLLMLGAGIALTDLLTDGQLSASTPALVIAWAVSQALGIDTQLLGCFARARTALRHARAWAMVGWLALGGILGYAAWQAGDVYAIQQSQHISEAAALAQLGIAPAMWLGWRAFLAVGLVALSGWTRYTAPGKVKPNAEAERADLERELMLEPLRQQLRAQRVGGVGALARTAIAAARGEASQPPITPTAPTMPSRPPTGGGSPSEAPVRTRRNTGGKPVAPIRLEPVRTGDEIDRAAAARAVQAERRAMRLGNILEWTREARAKGKPLTVGDVERKLKRIDRSRISRSTIQALMRLAEERLDREEAEGGQAAQ